ncbi:hypothetical protein DZG00_02920 [Clavibacter lycopersici]|uniref:Uncharacterized protein n=1 Tax=Clavibacter lycopersici TaxID=2301718 RepID=A0A399TCU5_9MICO|nr:hypothetical protein [Clavibacter lycopersici]RIJ52922.1 hypothetical protein DZG00_02920 [Clavibacter lycopersici]RIJ59863.1 hypothetical protein DZG02_11045 [Clavibacter lycopersici]
MTEIREPGRRRRRRILIVLAVVVPVLVLLALVRLAGLAVFATEGDVPAASSIPLPEGSAVVDESVDCASGGCWTILSVRPPQGMTPDELSAELGTMPQARIPGTLWDPRTISLTAEVQGSLLVVQADFWSQEYVP